MCRRFLLAWLLAVGPGVGVLEAQLPGQIDPRLADMKLPLAELNKILPGAGANGFLPPLPGQPLGAFMPPPGTNFLNGQYSPLMNQFGAQTPWPFQNPFTPSHWNYAGMNGYGMNGFGMNGIGMSGIGGYNWNNPWANTGMWTAPPFGQYGFGGYGNFAPIVGANNGWWPYDAGYNANPWNLPAGGMNFGGNLGWGGGMNFGGNPFAPNNWMFQRVP